jgi:prepilin-type N-terminal cleavage/methylation domain-containing protein
MKRRVSTSNRAAESSAALQTSGGVGASIRGFARPFRCSPMGAFTLIELLVVIAILGILAAIGLPKLSSFGQSNAVVSATRQLLDDVALARSRAISSRSDAYLVFISPNIVNFPTNNLKVSELTLFNNLLGGQYTAYALYATRSAGDQPGRSTPRYLTSWKTLPQGMFVAAFKFALLSNQQNEGVWGFQFVTVPFPLATSTNTPSMPCIAFDYQGRLTSVRDERIPLAHGSVSYARDATKTPIASVPSVIETPPGNSTNSYNLIHIDWLTGRTQLEQQRIK